MEKNILLDIDDCVGLFEDAEKKDVEFGIESICKDIINSSGGPSGFSNKFEIIINKKPITIWIKWDNKKEKYWLKSFNLSQFKSKLNPQISLTQFLNRKQSFRIIIDQTPDIVFSSGKFYQIGVQINARHGPGALVLGLLTGHPSLGSSITSEKGKISSPAPTWPKNSAFRLIDSEIVSNMSPEIFGESFDNVVCDDIGDEVADFIGINDGSGGKEKKIVFIAAKWSKDEPGAGASGLYDVCGQVLKNLAYLKSDGQQLPGSRTKWDKNWTIDKKSNGTVARKRVGVSSVEFRQLFDKLRSMPTTKREFWMVLTGGVLSKSALEKQFKKNYPKPHALQAFHLLLSVYAGCQSVGVELKVFCAQ